MLAGMIPRLVRRDDLHGYRFSEVDHCRLALLSSPLDADRRDDAGPSTTPRTICVKFMTPWSRGCCTPITTLKSSTSCCVDR